MALLILTLVLYLGSVCDLLQSSSGCSNPHASLSLALSCSLLATAAPQASMTWCRQVLVDGTTIGNEAQTQLEVPCHPAIRSQSQNQERSQQQESHHQQSHTTSIVQEIRTVDGSTMALNLWNKWRDMQEEVSVCKKQREGTEIWLYKLLHCQIR